MAAVRPQYIISKLADPIFAIFIGVSAATVRINREEKREGRDTHSTVSALLRRLRIPEEWRMGFLDNVWKENMRRKLALQE